MKRVIGLIISITLLFSLSACAVQEQKIDEPSFADEIVNEAENEQQEENTQEEAEAIQAEEQSLSEIVEAEPIEPELDWLELYKSVFENIREIDGADWNNYYGNNDTYNLLYNDFARIDLYIYGYKLIDLDNNGVPELIIGNMNREDTFSRDIIYVMFTLVDNEPMPILYSGARSRNYLSSLGSIYSKGSSGASSSVSEIQDYSGTDFTPSYGCFTSFDPEKLDTVYHKYERSDGNEVSTEVITREEYLEIENTLENSIIPMTDLIKVE